MTRSEFFKMVTSDRLDVNPTAGPNKTSWRKRDGTLWAVTTPGYLDGEWSVRFTGETP